jgi:CMP-N-acetylneuraminic acid synthetase
MKFAIVIPARKGSKGVKNKNLIKIKNIISKKHGLYVMNKSRSLDINDKGDLVMAEKML